MTVYFIFSNTNFGLIVRIPKIKFSIHNFFLFSFFVSTPFFRRKRFYQADRAKVLGNSDVPAISSEILKFWTYLLPPSNLRKMHIKDVNDGSNDNTFRIHFRNYVLNKIRFLLFSFQSFPLLWNIEFFFAGIVGNNLLNLPFTIC